MVRFSNNDNSNRSILGFISLPKAISFCSSGMLALDFEVYVKQFDPSNAPAAEAPKGRAEIATRFHVKNVETIDEAKRLFGGTPTAAGSKLLGSTMP